MRQIVQMGSKESNILLKPTATLQSENTPQMKRLTFMLMAELKGRHSIALGIALNQLNSPYHGFIVKLGNHYRTFFNATIIKHSSTFTVQKESCLSCNKGKDECHVKRWDDITINYLVHNTGRITSEKFSDMDARIIQHEIDHCNGITILDKAESAAKISDLQIVVEDDNEEENISCS
tara:strand:+ start:965 stop:1498 length:534 start_codon:yes stop_codon:yes gene_type:complete